MKRPSEEEFQIAVAWARAAIRASKKRPRIQADRNPETLLAKMQAKHAKGETLTEAEIGAWADALAEQTSRKQRGRGRPKGARDHAAANAFNAAAVAVHLCHIRTYRGSYTGHKLTRCDSIAEAMKTEGFRTFREYNGVEKQMKQFKRHAKTTLRDLQSAMARLQIGVQTFTVQMQVLGKALGDALANVQGIFKEPNITEKQIELLIKQYKSDS